LAAWRHVAASRISIWHNNQRMGISWDRRTGLCAAAAAAHAAALRKRVKAISNTAYRQPAQKTPHAAYRRAARAALIANGGSAAAASAYPRRLHCWRILAALQARRISIEHRRWAYFIAA